MIDVLYTQQSMTEASALRNRIRILLVCFIAGLVLSGVTAFPLDTELRILCSWLGIDPLVA